MFELFKDLARPGKIILLFYYVLSTRRQFLHKEIFSFGQFVNMCLLSPINKNMLVQPQNCVKTIP